jgi:3-dehydroquinate synthase
MRKVTYRFSGSSVDYYLAAGFSLLKKIVDTKNSILLTDENVYTNQQQRFKGWKVIVLKAGEEYKVQETVDNVILKLIEMEADRKTTLIGVGGGVITDLTGYIASIYMRGIPFGFVPTSLLALVDASIGGKNGIDVGVYKNMVGMIRQPGFILHDMKLLETLPKAEWENGFAEIIKHACIKDAAMFRQLEALNLKTFREKTKLLTELVQRNAILKTKVVLNDEFEKGERRMLNFGHTLGHALENQYELLHGQAVAIGMTYACHISEQLAGFRQTEKVVSVLGQYGLPTYASFNKEKVFEVLKMDKKRNRKEMNYVLLEKIGKGIIKSISLVQLEKIIARL